MRPKLTRPIHRRAIPSLGLLACCLFAATGMQPVSAQLPMLEPPWLGYYAVQTMGRFQFQVFSKDASAIVHRDVKGSEQMDPLAIRIDFFVRETLPDGKIIVRNILPETLEGIQPATTKLEKSVIRGKVAGDAAFEAVFEQSRGIISMGGRILDPGTLKNPQFCIRTTFPTLEIEKKAPAASLSKRDAKKLEREMARKTKSGTMELKWTDSKRIKQDLEVAVDAGSKELNGPGIAAVEIKTTVYDGKKFILLASSNSAMTLSNPSYGQLKRGFSLIWSADSGKDKTGAARFSFEMR